MDADEKKAAALLDGLKSGWNKAHEIKIKGHDLEVNFEDVNAENNITSIYSIKDNKWVEPPVKEKPMFNKNLIRQKYLAYKKQITQSLQDGDETELKNILEKLYITRQAGLDAKGEFSEENIVFKVLRAQGYLDKIKDTANAIYDKEMTINEVALNVGDYGERVREIASKVASFLRDFKRVPDMSKDSDKIASDFGLDNDAGHKKIARDIMNAIAEVMKNKKIDELEVNPDCHKSKPDPNDLDQYDNDMSVLAKTCVSNITKSNSYPSSYDEAVGKISEKYRVNPEEIKKHIGLLLLRSLALNTLKRGESIRDESVQKHIEVIVSETSYSTKIANLFMIKIINSAEDNS